jgi:predicted secreted hydrolase
MDHEFFSSQLDSSVAGWDWFASQLNNDEELMLYRLRKKSGGETRYSSGTFVDRQGKAHFLDASQISFTPVAVWRSPQSSAHYPVEWKISIPTLGIVLTEHPDLENQELIDKNDVSPSYWEGAVTYAGHEGSQAVQGVGYLEMTGYDRAFELQ